MKKIVCTYMIYSIAIFIAPTVYPIIHKPLKILFTTTYFPAFDGRFILNMMTGCIDAGHDVYIFAKHHGPKTTHENVNKYNLLERTYYGTVPNLEQFDIIFSQFGYCGQHFARLMRSIPPHKKPKLVTYFRGADITKYLKMDPHRYDELFQVGSLFFLVCNYFKKLLIKAGCNKDKIKILHSSIDCNAFSFNPPKWKPGETYNILSVSRLVEKKGLQYTLQALALIKKTYPNIHYYIIGEGEMRTKLEKLVVSLQLQGNVTFLGRLQENSIITLLHKCHVFVLPSITAKNGDQEGIPTAVKEAMACGLPVIVTKHAGNSELVIPGSGFLVPERDYEAIADRIQYLMQQPHTWASMGMKGRNHVLAEFEMNSTNKKLIEFFEKLTRRYHNRTSDA